MELVIDKHPSCEHLTSGELSHNTPKPLFNEHWMNGILKSLDKNNEREQEVKFEDGEELERKVEKILQARMKSGDSGSTFLLGQLCFEQSRYEEAFKYFEEAVRLKDNWQAMYQLGVMFYEGLGCKQDSVRGFDYMHRVATSQSSHAKHLTYSAQYNVGLAYYNGVGVKRSSTEAEKFWLMAADNGNPKASVRAQSTLGLFYSTGGNMDLEKAFYWHTEACGNGSLESQGALGVMYMNGLGTKRNSESAFICWREAARRGNIYATGHLVTYYYKHKLFTKALGLSARLSLIDYDAVEEISRDTECTALYTRKGIAMGCYYYGLCLLRGQAVAKDDDEAAKCFSRSFQFDEDVCAALQKSTQLGEV